MPPVGEKRSAFIPSFSTIFRRPARIREGVQAASGRVEDQVLPTRGGERLQIFARVAQNPRDIDMIAMQAEVPGVQPRQVDHVVDQAEHLLTGGDDIAVDHLLIGGIMHLSGGEHLPEADDGRQGGAEAMAHRGDEMMLLLHRGNQRIIEQLHLLDLFHQLQLACG